MDSHRLLILCCLTACGTVQDNDPDAAPAGEPDAAAQPDAPPASGPVAISFRYGSDLVADATVLIFDGAGALLGKAKTAGNGIAELADVPRGSTIMIGKFLGGAPRVATIVGVEPGDHITLGRDYGSGKTTKLKVAFTNISNVHHYLIGAGCGRTEQLAPAGTEIDALDECRLNGQWTVSAIAFSDQTTPVSFSVVAGATDQVPVTFATWNQAFNLGSFQVGFSNRPAGTNQVAVTFEVPTPIADSTYQTFTTDSGNAQFRYVSTGVDTLRYSVSANFQPTQAGQARFGTSVNRSTTPKRMELINIGLFAMPLITAAAGDFTNTARPVFTWSAPSGDADMVSLIGNWDGPGYYEWDLFMPPGTTGFTFPAVPLDVVDLIPPAGKGWTFDATVNHVDLETGVYRDARKDPWKAAAARTASRSISKVFE